MQLISSSTINTGTNFAPLGTVTATSEQKAYPVSNVVDGNVNNLHFNQSGHSEHVITFDLQSVKAIYELKITFYQSQHNFYLRL